MLHAGGGLLNPRLLQLINVARQATASVRPRATPSPTTTHRCYVSLSTACNVGSLSRRAH